MANLYRLVPLGLIVGSLVSQAMGASCTASISSLNDVSAAVGCNNIQINAFTVPAGKTFDLSSLASNTAVTLKGNVVFASGSYWSGPLFQIAGTNITFDGGNFTFDGSGPFYWDGQGSNGGLTKPDKMLVVKNSGIFKNLKVLNAPTHAFSVGNKAALVMSNIQIDNSAGRLPNSQSNGLPAGHNTDGFDVSATDITIQNSRVLNQDDCIAINSATNVQFLNNYCDGGHGVSIGSVKTGNNVNNVLISGNTIVNQQNGLRIKTYVNATSASVTNVTYSGNTVTNATDYGIIIEQDYTNSGATGTPTNGVIISGINFSGTMNTVSVASGAKQIYVLCGSGSCQGTWNWSKLTVTGGSKGSSNYPITGYTV